MDLRAYRESENEKARTSDLLRILPRGRRSVLDIGARDGHFSRLLAQSFETVTALDLSRPGFQYPKVTTVAGDATRLQFEDASFDCVFCAEVLEHIPAVQKACREIVRVARHEIVIGVPYRQDTRIGRTTCRTCRKVNPPWGHVNIFTEERLSSLFPNLHVVEKSFVGSNREQTNWLAVLLMDWAGNPWGSYSQDEPCIYCGAMLIPPPGQRPLWSKVFSGFSARMTWAQQWFSQPHGNWIHVVFSKDGVRR